MTVTLPPQTTDLTARFPGAVTAETRAGFSGFVVEKDSLVEVATAIRDELGYDLLTAVTAVDYLPDNKMEVVYHAYKTTGGPGLVFRVQVPRVDPVEVPSLINVYPSADLQEREAWDLFGIKFTGHPDLRRILMWEGYEGHPLRKDWKEPFYEEDFKPFKSRWPDGKFALAEEKTPLKDNLKFPENFDPEKWIPEADEMLYESLKRYTVQSEDGILYTRAGNLRLNRENVLVTQEGWPVLGKGGPITLENGELRVEKDGQVFDGDSEVDTLDLVRFAPGTQLEKARSGYLKPTQAAADAPLPAEGCSVAQGALEEPNFDVVQEMTQMIETSRIFEAYQKTLRMHEEQDANITTKLGNP